MATTTKRYQGWQLTPKGRIEGVWPIPSPQQPDEYVELETDTAENVVAIREKLEGSDKLLTRRPTYRNGRVQKSEYDDPTSGGRGAITYEYDARGLLCARHETSPSGKPRHRIEVRCDEHGRFAEEKVIDARKRLTEHHRYSYDEQGRMAKDEQLDVASGACRGFHALSYDDKGRLVRRAWHDASGRQVSAFAYAYDANDRRIEMTIESQGGGRMSRRLELDENGGTRAIRIVDARGKDVEIDGGGTAAPVLAVDRAVRAGAQSLGPLAGLDRKQLDAVCHLAYAQLEAGRFDESRSLFESLAALFPDNAYYLAGAGAAALQAGHPQTALNWYERALTHDENHLPSMVGRAEALLRKGDVDNALAAFRQVLMHAPTRDDPLVRRAQAIITALASATPPGSQKH